MAIKNLGCIVILALLSASHAYGVTCHDIDYPENVKISVVIEDGDDDPRKISVSVPSVILEKSLKWIFLWVSVDRNAFSDLQVPILYEIEGEEAHAEFYARRNWNAVQVTAHYGGKICDTSLEKWLWN
jgi:hypothetical protein